MAAMELHGTRGQNDGGVKVKFIETRFVSSDAASFKSVVQRLTGKSAPMPSPGDAPAPVPLHRPRARAPCPTAPGGWAEQASRCVVPGAGSNNLMMTTAPPIKREAHRAMPSAPAPRLEELHELCSFGDLFYATAGAPRDGVTNGFPY